MNTYKLTISSPEGKLFEEEVQMFTARGTNGDFAILKDHIPFVTTLQKCTCKILLPDGSERTGETEGGIVSVSTKGTVLLSSSFSWN